MSRDRAGGTTSLERLREHYDVELVCPDCGYEDGGGRWNATTNGAEIAYRHECPSCGSVNEHTFTLRGREAE